MSHDALPFVPRYRFNEGLLARETDGFAPEDWAWRPPQGGNSAQWIVGHVALYRRTLLRRLGANLPTAPWEAGFARGVTPSAAPPSTSGPDLAADLRASGVLLEERLRRATAAELAQSWGHALPDGSDTLAGAVSFLYFHETYHLGQVGYLRRLRGKPGLA